MFRSRNEAPQQEGVRFHAFLSFFLSFFLFSPFATLDEGKGWMEGQRVVTVLSALDFPAGTALLFRCALQAGGGGGGGGGGGSGKPDTGNESV